VTDEDSYDVALPNYLAYGGDRYYMIPKEKTHHKNTGFLDKDILISYLGKNIPLKLPSPGRIVIITSHNQVRSHFYPLSCQAFSFIHSLDLLALSIQPDQK